MGPEMETRIKTIFLGLILGAAVAIFIGFHWGGWTTAKSTQKMVEEAVLMKQGSICADQYLKSPNKLKEFEGIDSAKRTDTIEKGGWNKMPGQETADYGVSRACVDVLESRLKK